MSILDITPYTVPSSILVLVAGVCVCVCVCAVCVCVLGERFTQDEMEEMLSAAVDKEKGLILYKDFVTYMLPETTQL